MKNNIKLMGVMGGNCQKVNVMGGSGVLMGGSQKRNDGWDN